MHNGIRRGMPGPVKVLGEPPQSVSERRGNRRTRNREEMGKAKNRRPRKGRRRSEASHLQA